MGNQRTIHKALAGQEDILFGEGPVEQERAGGLYTIHKNRLIYPVNSLEELEALDGTKFPKARLYLETTVTDYLFDAESEKYVEYTVDIPASVSVFATVADLAAGTYTEIGTKVFVSDRGNTLATIQSTGTADGKGVLAAGGTNTAVVDKSSGEVEASWYGANSTNVGSTVNYIITDLNNPLLESTGGIIWLPFAEFALDETIIIHNPTNTFNIDSISLKGKGRQSTVIDAATAAGNALEIRFGIYNHIQDFTLKNAQGHGIFIDDGPINNEVGLNCSYERLVIRDSVGHGLLIGKGFIQSYDNMEYMLNGESGCHTGPGVTTSQHHSTSYSRNNTGNGFSSEYLIYSSYHGCAADENLHGYQVYGNRAVHYDSCGAESNKRAGWYFRSDASHEVNWVTGTALLGVNNNREGLSFANHTEMIAADKITNFVALKQPVSLTSQAQSPSTFDFKVQGEGAVLSLEDPLMENAGPKAAVGGFIQVNYTTPKLVHQKSFVGPQASRTLLAWKNQNGLTDDWSGEILITVSNAMFGSTAVIGTATYKLLVSKSLQGLEQHLVAKLGLVNGTDATHPSFAFTLSGGSLIATAVSQTEGDFWFAIEKVAGNLLWDD